jgi:hypothetical protein
MTREEAGYRQLGQGTRLPGRQVEEAPVEECPGVILRPALKLALGDAELTAAAWTAIRETPEDPHQGPLTGDQE